MIEHCKEKVSDRTGFHQHSCSRKAVVDGYCKQHSPDAVKARGEKGLKQFKEKMEQADWRQLQIARERIAELEAENKALREQVRWVPVSERLPTEDEMDWLEVGIIRMKDVFVSTAHVTDEMGLETWDGDDLGYEWRDVNYWRSAMPLPPPPQKSGE